MNNTERNEHVLQMVKRTTILQGVVGSTLHGLAVDDGLEDRDEMGVCIEDIDYHVGWEQFPGSGTYVFRTAEERQKEAGISSRGDNAPRSFAGDLDLVVHTLKKYLGLALNGNPTIINLLFVPESQLVVCDALGSQLRELAPKIVSRRAGRAFYHYMTQQYGRLTGVRGGKDVNRPDLVERYGYDTKYAMHVLRLGIQGIEIMETGKLTFPMKEPGREYLIRVRTGGYSLEKVCEHAKQHFEHLLMLIDDKNSSPLAAEPDVKTVESWMTDVYMHRWKSREFDAQIRRGNKT